MRTGRPPKPTVLKILEGNPGHRPLNMDEPVPDALSTDIPDVLISPEEKREWTERIVPAIERGQITEADFQMAVAHCQLTGLRVEFLREAAGQPKIIAAGKNGYPMPNPALVQASRILTQLVRVDGELGLTPSSRSRVKGVKNKAPKTFNIDKAREKFFNIKRG